MTNLTARDIVVTDQPNITPQGTRVLDRLVTFYVGRHGPFQLFGPAALLTAAAITKAVNEQVQEMQQLELLAPATPDALGNA